MPHFSEWTIEDARAALDAAIAADVGEDGFAANKAYAEEHDHWQKGDAWVGPVGGPAGSELREKVLAGVERQFTPVDIIAEVLDRCANALMQKEPDIVFQPLEPAEEDSQEEVEQKKAAEELRRQVSTWWDSVKLWEKARAALKRARWARRGALRLWIPPGNLKQTANGQQLPSGLELADALELIALDAPAPDVAIVITDPETLERAALLEFREGDGDAAETRFELWFFDGDDVVFRILGQDEDDDEEYRIRMVGRLPINEMETDLLITEPVRRQQARLNFAESLLTRVAETGGFPERYIANAQPHGLWLKTPPTDGVALETKEFRGDTYYLHQAPRTLGSAVTTDLRGIVTGVSADGRTPQIATPGVTFKDPTDPEYAIKAARHARRTVLEQCKQGHVALDGTAEASGTAYQQARADFEADLGGVKPPVEGLLRDTIEAAIAMAEAMGGSAASVLDRFRVAVNLNISSGPITPAERQQNNADVQAGTLSRPSAMAKNGVEDVAAELERIGNEPESVIALRTKQVEAVARLVAEGMTWLRGAKIIGIDDKALLKEFAAQDGEDAEARAQEDAQDDEIDDALSGNPEPRQSAA